MIHHAPTENVKYRMGEKEIREEAVSRALLNLSEKYYASNRIRHMICYSLARDNRFLERSEGINTGNVEEFAIIVEESFMKKIGEGMDKNKIEENLYEKYFDLLREIAINIVGKIN